MRFARAMLIRLVRQQQTQLKTNFDELKRLNSAVQGLIQ